MNIEFRKSFEKDLEKLRESALLQRIKLVIEEIEIAENIGEVRDAKKLKGEGGYYRIRVGDYRIGIILQENTVILIRLLHRKDIYRYFP